MLLHFTGLYRIAQCVPCYGFVVLGAFAGYKKAAIIGGSAWFEINPIQSAMR